MRSIVTTILSLLLLGLFLTNLSLTAQEQGTFKKLFDETVDFKAFLQFDQLLTESMESDSGGYIVLNVNKKPLPKLGYSYNLNSLFLNYKDSLPIDPIYTISPALTARYTNQSPYDPFSTATTTDVIVNGILTPVLALPKLDFVTFFSYLMKLGILSSDDPISTESKKEKALREIKTLHGIED